MTAAALLFAIAIGAFATSQIIFIKENGVGTALAVLIDASLIRALLVPSLMELLGDWNWWAPRPLRRLHRPLRAERNRPRRGRVPRHPRRKGPCRSRRGPRVCWRIVTIATAIFLIAIGAILRYAINVHSDVINIQTVGLILMIAGGAGLALSLLYELVQQGGRRRTTTSTHSGGAGTTTRPAACKNRLDPRPASDLAYGTRLVPGQ